MDLETNRKKDHSFISDEAIKPVIHQGKRGYKIRVRLTSYRSLPLSCIDKIELTVDGIPIAPNKISFILNGYSHSLSEFAQLSHIWWFILDYADLFIESDGDLGEGEHLVKGLLVTVEPYVTAGRFLFHYPCEKRLRMAEIPQEVAR